MLIPHTKQSEHEIKDEKSKKTKREQSRSYSEFAFERYNKVRAWATRAVGEIPSSKTLRRQ